jgi:hypothetical protein
MYMNRRTSLLVVDGQLECAAHHLELAGGQLVQRRLLLAKVRVCRKPGELADITAPHRALNVMMDVWMSMHVVTTPGVPNITRWMSISSSTFNSSSASITVDDDKLCDHSHH